MTDGRGPVLITGASRGLGRALALEFARRGHDVALCARGREELERVAAEVRGLGAVCVSETVDVADAGEVERWVALAARELGAPAVLINNASLLGPRVDLANYPAGEWERAVAVNLNGAFFASRAVVPQMIDAGGGAIINVSSGAAIPPRVGWGAYAVSKAAVEALTRNMAEELAETGVRVNAVDPGAMRTGMRAAAYPEEDPSRLKTPEETTGVFVWLTGPGAAELTGERISADEWIAEHAPRQG